MVRSDYIFIFNNTSLLPTEASQACVASYRISILGTWSEDHPVWVMSLEAPPNRALAEQGMKDADDDKSYIMTYTQLMQ